MTRRERLERKLKKRRAWAASAAAASERRFKAANEAVAGIPFGQPILVGHHSERRHRAALGRSDANMAAGVADAERSRHHESKAGGLERQLEGAIYSGDADAAEALEAKAAELDKDAERSIAINKAWRKHKANPEALQAAWNALGLSDALCVEMATRARTYSWTDRQGPCDPTYARSNARRARERIKEVNARAERTAAAEAAAGGVMVEGGEAPHYWCRVTFAEKPAREVLNALKAAGYRWGGGYWAGDIRKLPAEVGQR